MASTQLVKLVLQILSTVILARLLTPNDFGLMAMVVVVTGLIGLFQDVGLSDAIIQQEEVSQEQLSILFWVNVIIGIFLTIAGIIVAPVVAGFYQEPKVEPIICVLSFSFFFSSLAVQHRALIRKDMRFSALAKVDIFALASGIIVAVAGAIYGLSYWSLVLMQLTTCIASTLGAWVAFHWLPGRLRTFRGVGSLLVYGGHRSYTNIVSYLNRNLDKVMLGRVYGAEVTGIYSRAFTLLLLPISQLASPLMSVMMPALSKLQRDEIEYRNYYLKSLSVLAYSSMPMVALMAALSDPIIRIVLGEQWLGAIDVFRVLAVASFWLPVSQSVLWVYLSLGTTRRMAIWFTMASPITILSYYLFLPWGGIGMALAHVIVTWCLFVPMFAYCLKGTNISVLHVLRVCFIPAMLALSIGSSVYFAQDFISYESPLLRLLVGAATTIFILLIGFLLSASFRSDVASLLRWFRSALSPRQM